MSNKQKQVPDHFICPITQEIFQDPVVDREGVSYEREAIMKWLQNNSTSPMTRKPLSKGDLVPNRALKETIDQFNLQSGNNKSNEQSTDTTGTIGPENKPEQKRGSTTNKNTTNENNNENPIGVNIYQHPKDPAELIALFTPPKLPPGCAGNNTIAKNRSPVDIVCCVDVSGSTGSSAPTQDKNGVKEETGLTILQIVGHAVRTIAALLGDDDRLSIVTYSNDARITFPLQFMNTINKANVDRIVKDLDPQGRTNMWAGIQKSIDVLTAAPPTQNNATKSRVQSVLLLTDGMPTQFPPRGHEATLRSLLKRTFPGDSRPLTIHTFGFGYDLDSKLLDNIAEIGGGSFNFISDAGLVGTNFVNAVAILLSTAATDVSITIPASAREQKEKETAGSSDDEESKTDLKINFGEIIRYGSSDPFWISGASERAKVVTVSFNCCSTGQRISLEVPVQSPESLDVRKFERMNLRRAFVDTVRAAARASPNATDLHKHLELVRETLNSFKTQKAAKKNSDMSSAFAADLQDQVVLALKSQDYFTRWGSHYFLSLARANELAVCNNFKDKSVALWKTKMFDYLQEAGETTFLSLAPPEPSLEQQYVASLTNNTAVPADIQAAINKQQQGRRGQRASSSVIDNTINRPAAPVSMRSYYNRGGGCVLGSCQVLMEDGKTSKNAEDVRAGDVLSNGSIVEVAFRINKKDSQNDNDIDKKMSLVYFESGLVISEFHPIRTQEGNGKCVFPVDVKENVQKIEETDVDYLYTFMLRSSSENENKFININGIDVLSWGHGIENDSVARHDFFGSREKIMECVSEKKMKTSSSGVVDVAGFVRDEETNRIVAMF